MRSTLPVIRCFAWGLLIGFAGTARAVAEVEESTATGFSIRIEQPIRAAPEIVYHAVVDRIGEWWHPEHTFSGRSANLSIEAEPHGWLIERLDNGGFVRHLELVYLAPNERMRMLGALGPLQSLPVNGVTTWTFQPADHGCTVVLEYRVTGRDPRGLDVWAEPVDQVLSIQLERLRSLVEDGDVPDDGG